MVRRQGGESRIPQASGPQASEEQDPAEEPHEVSPLDLRGLRQEERRRRAAWLRAQRDGAGILPRLKALGAWLQALSSAVLPVRVLQNYSTRNGPLAAAGMAFRMFFSIGALVVSGLGIGGLLLNGHPRFRDQLLDAVDRAVPGVFASGAGPGLVDPADLLSTGGLSWTVGIALLVAVFGSLGWIGGMRDGMRLVADRGRLKLNPVLARVRDLVTLALLGLALVLSVALTLFSSTVLHQIFGRLPLEDVLQVPFLPTAAGFVLNWCAAALLLRVGARIRFPRRPFLEGTLLSAVVLSLLQALSSQLLAHVGRNPVMASLGIVVGVLLWFNLLSQVLLLGTSWAAVRAADLRPSGKAPPRRR
ncbi:MULTISPECIES: YihY/virulence factor BrkB family protein [Arthrobacter]|uniref:YihY/virulence factor BrkB family protein n=2 Tax=Arthrobacter TaxID=1663 RepID=A0ABU9KKM3_9MICC|nr:YihY/virulence factor BrkB family protein [Arthrobacter sp. YJM1]MDP5227450.1 YihY/virulence factor BrkB family protein [Arthrobacter sp. YJM1]